MWGRGHIIEVDDMHPKVDLMIKAKSYGLFDLCSRARDAGTRWDHIQDSIKRNNRFRYSTLVKLSHIFEVPLGCWLWTYPELEYYVEKRRVMGPCL